MNIINSIKRYVTKHYAPYEIEFYRIAQDGIEGEWIYTTTEIHHSWTLKDALEWMGCSLREEGVIIFRGGDMVAVRREANEV